MLFKTVLFYTCNLEIKKSGKFCKILNVVSNNFIVSIFFFGKLIMRKFANVVVNIIVPYRIFIKSVSEQYGFI